MNRKFTIEHFFDRMYRYEKFLKINVPSAIIEQDRRLLMRGLVELKRDTGIDGLQYLQTDEGKARYLVHMSESDEWQKACDRCDRCSNLHFLVIDKGDENFKCSVREEIGILNCPDFCDCGRVLAERIAESIIKRCGTCKNSFTSKNIIDIETFHCKFNNNMIALFCELFENKD